MGAGLAGATAAEALRSRGFTARVVLIGGERIGYHRLLLAPGPSPRRLAVPGAVDGVLYLRTVDDCEPLRAAFAHRGPVVSIGAGWIGLETAA